MPYDNKITGQILRALRLERGLTQEVLSGLAAVSRSHLAAIESGAVSADVDTLWRISDALGVRLSEVMRRVEDESRK